MRQSMQKQKTLSAGNRKIVSMLMSLVIGAFMLLCPAEAMAQKVTVHIEQGTLDQAFQTLMKKSNIQLVYNTNAATSITCRAQTFSNKEVGDILITLLAGTDLDYLVKDGIYTIVKIGKNATDAREGKVTGKVLDETGEPIVGASVLVIGSEQGNITNIDGIFSIEKLKKKQVTLRISYLGMKTIEQTVALNSSTVFRMQEDATMISEVVITGYQDISKEKMTGSVITVRADNLEERYTPNIMSNLEGRVAGLTTYGGKTTIRGTSSLYAETNPLLVVDGLPIEGSIEDLNPYDIETVNVLKDAAATAIYGARASNGIIVITTKNAKKKGKVDIDFSANLTIYEKKNMDYSDNFLMNAEQQVNAESDYYEYYFFNNEGEIKDPIASTASTLRYGYSEISPIYYAYYRLAQGEISREQLNDILNDYRDNNFAKEYADRIYKQQILQQYNLSVRSRSDKYQSNLTLNYKHDNSGQVNTSSSAININYKGIYEVARWLTASFSINSIYAQKKEPGYDMSAEFDNPWLIPAYESMYNSDGSDKKFYYYYSGHSYWNNNQEGFYDLGLNIYDEFYNNTETTKRNHMRYHTDLLFKVIKGLTINTQFIYEKNHTTTSWHANVNSHVSKSIRNAYATKEDGKIVYLTPEKGGMLNTTNTDGDYWTARGQINYSNTFGKHTITALAGLEFRQTQYSGTKSLILGYDEQLQSSATHTVDFAKLSQLTKSPLYMLDSGGYYAKQYVFNPYLSDAMGIVPEETHRYASGYANLTYTYDEKYNVFASFRKDYADVYGLNSKFRGKPLWSVGAGWNMHNEDFMKQIEWLNFLKLRYSYGVTGNIYQGATSYMTATTGELNYHTNLPMGEVESPANPNLKWEQSRTHNIGIDFSLLNNRLRGSFDYYKKIGEDIFSNRTLDPSTGFTSMFVNTASMENKGVEIQLTYDWLVEQRRKDFGWSTSLTFSHNKNEITGVENPSTYASQLINNPYRTGYPASALWSYRFAGISDAEGEKGRCLWYIEDGNTARRASSSSIDILEYSGQTDPKVVMGLDNRFTWNGFSINILLSYYGGHQMRALLIRESMRGFQYGTVASYFLNAWTPENPTNIPGLGRYGASSIGSETRYGNNSIHDADFLKVRNIVFGYDLPESWLKNIGVNRVALRFQIDNPKAIWVKNKVGIDPETQGLRNPSSFIFGLNVNL